MGRGHGGSRAMIISMGAPLARTERGYTQTLAKAVLKEEAAIRGLNVEHGIIIDKQGNVISHSVGTEHEVRIEGSWRDNIVTHNHPGGRSFSSTDIMSTVGSNAAEMRIVGRSGYTFSIKRPASGWGMTGQQAKAAYSKEYKRVENSYENYLFDKSVAGRWSEGDRRYKAVVNHVVMKNLASRYGWNYSKTKSN